MLQGVIKKIFKIESIFIYAALAIFFKRASNNLIQKLDTEMLLLQMDPKSIVTASDSADIFGHRREMVSPLPKRNRLGKID